MVTSCFFCQNLLSDYLEGLLPSSREEELSEHLKGCGSCRDLEHDLQSTVKLLHSMPARELSHDMALRITEASQAGRAKFFTRTRVSRMVMLTAIPCLLFAGVVAAFPKLFPWFSRLPASTDESQFVKYSPLAQGASEVIDEQANWLQVRQPNMRSVWEEGGLSPEEFEKAFEIKPALPKASKGSEP